ncbi:MAG: DciA family protein [Microvirga sp.]
MRPTRSRTRPLADFINVCLGPSLAAQGFAAADVITAWPEIVGARLAEFTQPLKIEWKKRRFPGDPDQRPEPATLVVRVEGAFALELQHLAPIVIERVNAHYGWRCIGRLAMRQAPVRRARREKPQAPTLSAADRERIARAAEPIEEDRLREALGRLGEAVLGSAQAGPATKP